MIGRQINFFATLADQEALLRSIETACGFRVLRRTFSHDYQPTTNIAIREEDWPEAYLFPPGDSPARARDIRERSFDAIAAIQFGFSMIDSDGNLQPGRLWFSKRYVENGAFVAMPQEFLDWGDRVLRVTRRELVKFEKGYWSGKEAIKLLRAGDLTPAI